MGKIVKVLICMRHGWGSVYPTNPTLLSNKLQCHSGHRGPCSAHGVGLVSDGCTASARMHAASSPVIVWDWEGKGESHLEADRSVQRLRLRSRDVNEHEPCQGRPLSPLSSAQLFGLQTWAWIYRDKKLASISRGFPMPPRNEVSSLRSLGVAAARALMGDAVRALYRRLHSRGIQVRLVRRK